MKTATNLLNDKETFREKSTWKDYLELCKPRVVALMILTSIVGMCLATHGPFPWRIFLLGNLGIGLAACSAASINHLADHRIDRLMARTHKRPMPTGKMKPHQVCIFSAALCLISMTILIVWVNALTALLTFLSLIAYAGVYTYYLKHATSQNIVIGGIAGASPPLLGWVAVTGHIQLPAVILMLIIFIWTPPHFWALAIARVKEYAKAKVPMLPNTHGIAHTKMSILIYTIMLFAMTLLPFCIHSSNWIYLISAIALNCRFSYWVIKLYRTDTPSNIPMKTFKFSITYLMLLFMALLIDHYVF